MQQLACLTKGHNSTSVNSWAVHAKRMGLPLPATPASCCQQYVRQSQIAQNMWREKNTGQNLGQRALGKGHSEKKVRLPSFLFCCSCCHFFFFSRKHAQNSFNPLPGRKVSWCFTPSQPARLYQGDCLAGGILEIG